MGHADLARMRMGQGRPLKVTQQSSSARTTRRAARQLTFVVYDWIAASRRGHRPGFAGQHPPFCAGCGRGTMSGQLPAGWYDDPETEGQERFWDGQRWWEDHRTPIEAVPQWASSGLPSESVRPTDRGLSPQHPPTGFQPHVLLLAVGLGVMIVALLTLLRAADDISRVGDRPLIVAFFGAVITVAGLFARQTGITWDSTLGRRRGNREPSGSAHPAANRSDTQAPMTPEQRLNRLLLMHQAGRLSDAEYQTARERIIGDL